MKRLAFAFVILSALAITGRALNFKPLSFGSFYVENFGLSKLATPGVTELLVSIFRRWDLALLVGIKDPSNTAIYDLLDLMNNETGPEYKLVLSPNLGRDSSDQEQFGFFYRSDILYFLDAFLYDDIKDVFEREPYVALFNIAHGYTFFVIPSHTQPTSAVQEIQQLRIVFDEAYAKWSDHKIYQGIIAGNLNAGCAFVTPPDMETIDLKSNLSFTWIIPDDTDSLVDTTNHCPFDRIIISNVIPENVVPGSAGVFDFGSHFDLNLTTALSVSSHYPVEVVFSFDPPTGSGIIIGVSVGVFIILILVVVVLIAFQNCQKKKIGGYMSVRTDEFLNEFDGTEQENVDDEKI